MATLDYQRRLSNLENRRFDNVLNESALSTAYRSTPAPENIRYLLESMTPIDAKYNDRTILAANRVKGHLEHPATGLKLHFQRAYRTQGSVMTKTNIKVYSDFDLLAIVDRYHYAQTVNNPYTASDPDTDIQEMWKQGKAILSEVYDEVDTSNPKCISVVNKSLNRKVDVVFAFWYNTDEFDKTGQEYYRGVHLYQFPSGPREAQDFPFAHMWQVNAKGDETADGSRRAIRLLKTLKADCDSDLSDLKSFHLTAIVHAMDSTRIRYYLANHLAIATETSEQIRKIVDDSTYRKSIKSPNGTENPLAEDEIVPLLRRLKEDLDELIVDATREMNSQAVRNAVQAYRNPTLLRG